MNRKYNVLFIFVDSVRTYFSNDDRGRLEIMDQFSRDSVECLNVVTSAPSTFMSISAMMTGTPAYLLNRNYNDFLYDETTTISLPSMLKKEGYNLYNFWMAPISRVTMKDLLPCVPRKYWPKKFKHADWWSNAKINDLVSNTLKKIDHHNRPNFFFVNYNCREDKKTSEIVAENIEKFREYGYTKENTITVLCSDHGYPDPDKVTGNPSFYKLNKLGHDLVLTDDNVMIPFFIQYPDCLPIDVKSLFSTLDIMPTILDILSLDHSVCRYGNSMLPIINGVSDDIEKNSLRLHRCDSRLAFQKGKGTAIRNSDYKYIYYHDNFFGDLKEEFFDLANDKLEENNLVKSNEQRHIEELQKFKMEFRKSEEEAMIYQEEYLFKKFQNRYLSDLRDVRNVLIIDSAYFVFINMLTKILHSVDQQINIFVLNISEKASLFEATALIKDNDKAKLDIETFFLNFNKTKDTQLIIFPSYKKNNADYDKLSSLISKMNINVLRINYNLVKDDNNSFIRRVAHAYKDIPFLIYEPLNLLKFILKKTVNIFK